MKTRMKTRQDKNEEKTRAKRRVDLIAVIGREGESRQPVLVERCCCTETHLLHIGGIEVPPSDYDDLFEPAHYVKGALVQKPKIPGAQKSIYIYHELQWVK